MTPKEVFAFAGTVGAVLERTGVFGADGNWADPLPPQAVIRAVAELEASLEAAGVTVPAQLSQYFRIADAIAPLIR